MSFIVIPWRDAIRKETNWVKLSERERDIGAKCEERGAQNEWVVLLQLEQMAGPFAVWWPLLTATQTPVTGGWSLRRMLRTEESDGVSPTWPLCLYTACLSCGAALSTALCCLTWGLIPLKRLQVITVMRHSCCSVVNLRPLNPDIIYYIILEYCLGDYYIL